MLKNKLYINSSDRSSGDPSNFRLDLNHPIQAVTGISLGRINLANTFYGINETNRTLTWLEGATSLTVNLDLGDYPVGDGDTDNTGFLYLLKTAMDAASVADGASKTYEVTYDRPTALISLATEDDTVLTVTAVEPLCSVLGITSNKASALVTGDRQLNLRPESNIYIETSLPIVSRVGNQKRSVIAQYNMDAAFAGYSSQQDWDTGFDVCNLAPTTISHIDLRLVDHAGNILNNRGFDWSAQLFYTTLSSNQAS